MYTSNEPGSSNEENEARRKLSRLITCIAVAVCIPVLLLALTWGREPIGRAYFPDRYPPQVRDYPQVAEILHSSFPYEARFLPDSFPDESNVIKFEVTHPRSNLSFNPLVYIELQLPPDHAAEELVRLQEQHPSELMSLEIGSLNPYERFLPTTDAIEMGFISQDLNDTMYGKGVTPDCTACVFYEPQTHLFVYQFYWNY